MGAEHMHETLITLYVKFQTLASSEEGQDLVEYGLLCTLIALATISGIGHVATAVSHLFTNVSTSLA
jgi:Flp pilus assembly pilin Flp